MKRKSKKIKKDGEKTKEEKLEEKWTEKETKGMDEKKVEKGEVQQKEQAPVEHHFEATQQAKYDLCVINLHLIIINQLQCRVVCGVTLIACNPAQPCLFLWQQHYTLPF